MAEANGVMDSGNLSPLSFDLMVMVRAPACEMDEIDIEIDPLTVYYIDEDEMPIQASISQSVTSQNCPVQCQLTQENFAPGTFDTSLFSLDCAT